MLKKTIYNLLFLTLINVSVYSQIVIPNDVFTHEVIKNGDWTSTSTWANGEIPKTGALVRIPSGKKVNYNVNNSTEHIFVIKNEGEFNIYANTGGNRKLIVDTFYNTPTSKINFFANKITAGDIDIEIRPYDIKSKVNNNSSFGGEPWKSETLSYFNGGEDLPVYDHFGNTLPSDGAGVYGRYKWDKNQVSLCLMTMGTVRIKGKNKLDFSELSANVSKGITKINLKKEPKNWEIGDDIVVTGTQLVGKKADEVFKIVDISGTEITLSGSTKSAHTGIVLEGKAYYPYVANLSRSIKIHSTFTETQTDITKRGHTMFMLNGDIQIINTLFKDLGRTDKSNIIDDLKLGKPTITGIGNSRKIQFPEGDLTEFDDIKNVENQRGRYGFHFHKSLRGVNSEKLIIAKGNVVWGSPGWGMVHHDSHADFTDNVVFDIEGGGMIAESGSETGIWKSNIVIGVRYDSTSPFLPDNDAMPAQIRRTLRTIIDDDFKGGAAYGLQGRAIRMVDNVATTSGVAYHYQGTGESTALADKVATSIFEKEGQINPFPLRAEVVRTAVPIIEFKGNLSLGCSDGFKSQGRISGAFHRVLSVIDQLTVINSNRFCIYVSSNFGYLFKNSIIHQASTGLTGTASGVLIQTKNDNLNFNFVKFYNVSTDGIEVETRARVSSGNNAESEFVFNRVSWLKNSGVNGISDLRDGDPYPDPNEKSQIKVTDNDPNTNFVVKFAKSSTMDDEIDFNGSLRFAIEGEVTDAAGTVKFPSIMDEKDPILFREYIFNNKNQVEAYINSHGGIKSEGSRRYFNFTEHMSNRISGNITPVEIKIYVLNYTASTSNNELSRSNIVIYPNPVEKGFVNIVCAEDITINIFDVNGALKMSFSKEGNDSTPTNIQMLSTGLYLMEISYVNTKTKEVKQLIVK